MENKKMEDIFSSNIKYFREIKNMSMNELAKKSKISVPNIMRYERKETSPSIDKVLAISKVFNVFIGDFLTKDFSKGIDNENKPIKEIRTASGTIIQLHSDRDISQEDLLDITKAVLNEIEKGGK